MLLTGQLTRLVARGRNFLAVAIENQLLHRAIFLYDEQADRYVLTQFAVSATNSVCWAVSQTNSTLGIASGEDIGSLEIFE